MEYPEIKSDNGIIPLIMEIVVKYGIFIMLLLFSIMAKAFTMYRYRKRMPPWQCFFEGLLCGLGSSIVIYCVFKMQLHILLTCAIGGFSGLAITPISMSIVKEAPSILDLIAKGVRKYITNFFRSKE